MIPIPLRFRTDEEIEGWARYVTYKPPVTLAAGDTSPSVGGSEYFETANPAPTTITAFDDGLAGQQIAVRLDANTTVQHNANIVLRAGANLVGTGGTVLVLYKGVDGVWRQPN